MLHRRQSACGNRLIVEKTTLPRAMFFGKLRAVKQPRYFKTIATIAAVILLAIAVFAIRRLYRGDDALLRDAVLSESMISPNADGTNDATSISYTITRNAIVSIYFESNSSGERFYFRDSRLRGAGDYSVLFSGVVQAYQLPDEVVSAEIIQRLLQNDTYTWTIDAVDDKGVRETATGELVIADADTILPDMTGYEIFPTLFSPNRDGIDDRVKIQFDLAKEVATLRVFLRTHDDDELAIQEQPRGVAPLAEGRHIFDYEGGVDLGVTPPEDGVYQIVAYAEDAEGQKMTIESSVTLEYGGVPRAEVVSPVSADTLRIEDTSIQLCDTLHFEITVKNYGDTPIRTTGPAPGVVYDNDWNYNSLGWHTESGAWRVAIGYEDETKDYPYRWAVGQLDELTQIGDFYYLMPDQTVVVSGGIRLVEPFSERREQPMWAGLIHEDVEISQFNNRVNPHSIRLELPAEDSIEPCPERDVPFREQQ